MYLKILLIIASRFNWGDIQEKDRRESSGPFLWKQGLPMRYHKKITYGEFFVKDLLTVL